MSQTPFAHAESLRIGTVEFISPDEVKVLLDIEAPDSVALNAGGVRPFPRVNGYVLFTHDLDFGAILAATEAEGPSVIQIRAKDISPDHAKTLLLNVLDKFEKDLLQGVLISVDEERSRVRLLPLTRDKAE